MPRFKLQRGQLVPFTPEEEAQVVADRQKASARKALEEAEETRRTDLRAEPDVQDLFDRLKTATAAQINTWIDTNIVSLAAARALLKTIVKLLAYVVRRLD
jgi:sarcosine oxidase gamma subunit